MFRQRKREFLPWYRQPGYHGNIAEEEKRHLDGIRDRGQHPAVKYEQLPEEAQSYINKLEVEVYDAKQQALVGRAVFLSAIGALLIGANFLGLVDPTNSWTTTIVAVPLLVLPWLFYVRQWRRNADEFTNGPADGDDEKLREAWELDYIVKRRHRGD